MFLCECQRTFVEPDYIKEEDGKYRVCPYCHSEYFSKAYDCVRCGSAISEDDTWFDDCLKPYCKSCYEEMEKETEDDDDDCLGE